MRLIAAVVLAFAVSVPVHAGSGTNCRLVIQVHYKNGKKRVKVEETGAMSHAECKEVANQRRLDSEDDDVQKINVVFGYRELSIIEEE